MIVVHARVYDGGLSGNGAVHSPPALDAVLGRAQRWYITVRATRVSGTLPTMNVKLQHSSTGSPAEFKDLVTTGTPTINGFFLSFNAINLVEGSLRLGDASVSSPGPFVRAEIWLGGTSPNAEVAVWITGRDDR